MTKAKADTPAPILPDFEAGVSYEVQMASAVEYPPGSNNWLRPDHRVTMDGALAALLKEHILGAGIAAAA